MICTEEEEKLKKTPFEVTWTDEASAKPMKAKVVVAEMLGGRRQDKSKEYLYEVLFRTYCSAQTVPRTVPHSYIFFFFGVVVV
jgi:hypothetical protein